MPDSRESEATVRAPVGRHYQGALGQQYFAYQAQANTVAAATAAELFAPYVSPDDAVVDFGSGAGGLLSRLRARRRIAVEPNDAARAAAAAAGLETAASTSDLPAASIDVCVSNHALEHTLAPVAELQGLRRVLKPGGRLALCLPLDDWRAQKVGQPDVNHHLYTWTPLLIANLLDEAGFEVRETRIHTHALPYYNELLYRTLPRGVFDRVCRLWSLARRQRQLVAIAVRPQADDV